MAAARNLLIVGHSHVLTLRAAAVRRREADPDRPRARTIHLLDPAFGGELAGERAEDGFSAGVAAAVYDHIARHDPLVVSAIGGHAHVVVGLLQPGRRFDFVLSDGPDMPKGLEPLPIDPDAALIGEDEARALLLPVLEWEYARLRIFRDLVGPFLHLQPPPPVRRNDWLFTHAESFFTDQAAFAVEAIAPPGVRYRLWRLAARMVAEECARLDCPYVHVPRSVCGAAGMLRPSQASDATHGNPSFGEAVLEELDGWGVRRSSP